MPTCTRKQISWTCMIPLFYARPSTIHPSIHPSIYLFYFILQTRTRSNTRATRVRVMIIDDDDDQKRPPPKIRRTSVIDVIGRRRFLSSDLVTSSNAFLYPHAHGLCTYTHSRGAQDPPWQGHWVGSYLHHPVRTRTRTHTIETSQMDGDDTRSTGVGMTIPARRRDCCDTHCTRTSSLTKIKQTAPCSAIRIPLASTRHRRVYHELARLV